MHVCKWAVKEYNSQIRPNCLFKTALLMSSLCSAFLQSFTSSGGYINKTIIFVSLPKKETSLDKFVHIQAQIWSEIYQRTKRTLATKITELSAVCWHVWIIWHHHREKEAVTEHLEKSEALTFAFHGACLDMSNSSFGTLTMFDTDIYNIQKGTRYNNSSI